MNSFKNLQFFIQQLTGRITEKSFRKITVSWPSHSHSGSCEMAKLFIDTSITKTSTRTHAPRNRMLWMYIKILRRYGTRSWIHGSQMRLYRINGEKMKLNNEVRLIISSLSYSTVISISFYAMKSIVNWWSRQQQIVQHVPTRVNVLGACYQF